MTKRRRRSKSWIKWLFFLILIICILIVAYLAWNNYFKNKKTEGINEPETTEELIVDTPSENIEINEEEEKAIQYEGEDPNVAENLSGTITYAGALDDSLVIRVNIDQYLNDGKCEINLFNGNAVVYSDEARIISSASTSTCEGFDVPLNQISGDYYGKFDIEIKLTSNDKTGTIRREVSL